MILKLNTLLNLNTYPTKFKYPTKIKYLKGKVTGSSGAVEKTGNSWSINFAKSAIQRSESYLPGNFLSKWFGPVLPVFLFFLHFVFFVLFPINPYLDQSFCSHGGVKKTGK
jgi:hypothetical protein